jgi:hypothetical protein
MKKPPFRGLLNPLGTRLEPQMSRKAETGHVRHRDISTAGSPQEEGHGLFIG